MIKIIILYKNDAGITIEVIARAGRKIYPYCYPDVDFNSIEDYTETELQFCIVKDNVRSSPMMLEEIVGAPIFSNMDGSLFTYKLSLFDRKICAPNCPNSADSSSIAEGGYLDKCLEGYNFKRYDPKQKEQKPFSGGTRCRVCNEFNNYAEPDEVIGDAKYTCWTCAANPLKRWKGLSNQEQVSMVMKLNNIKG